jgi:ribonuclease HI
MTTEHPKQDAKEIKTIQIYIDGNNTPLFWDAGGAFILQEYIGGNLIRETERSIHVEHATNIRAELCICSLALRECPKGTPTIIQTDLKHLSDGVNSYLEGWVAKGMLNSSGKPVKNANEWLEISELLAGRDVKVEWVKGAAGEPLKVRTDKLAMDASGGLCVDRVTFDGEEI